MRIPRLLTRRPKKTGTPPSAGRHRLADGDAVPLNRFPTRHGWNEYRTQVLPVVQDERPLMTPGQEYRARGMWRECDG